MNCKLSPRRIMSKKSHASASASLPTRQAPRYKADARIVVQTQPKPKTKGKPREITGRLTTMSESGFGASLLDSIGVGDHVSLRLAFLHPCPDPLPAVVRNVRGSHHGCQFLDLNEQRRAVLRRAFKAFPREA